MLRGCVARGMTKQNRRLFKLTFQLQPIACAVVLERGRRRSPSSSSGGKCRFELMVTSKIKKNVFKLIRDKNRLLQLFKMMISKKRSCKSQYRPLIRNQSARLKSCPFCPITFWHPWSCAIVIISIGNC